MTCVLPFPVPLPPARPAAEAEAEAAAHAAILSSAPPELVARLAAALNATEVTHLCARAAWPRAAVRAAPDARRSPLARSRSRPRAGAPAERIKGGHALLDALLLHSPNALAVEGARACARRLLVALPHLARPATQRERRATTRPPRRRRRRRRPGRRCLRRRVRHAQPSSRPLVRSRASPARRAAARARPAARCTGRGRQAAHGG